MRKPWSEERRRARVSLAEFDESRTVQSDRDRAEIKQIMAKYEATGIVDHLRQVDLDFRDVPEFTDLADVMQQAKLAESEFMKLPSKVREVFEHDVSQWLDAAHDPEKVEQLYRPKLERLGLLEPLEAPPEPAGPPEPAPEAPAA